MTSVHETWMHVLVTENLCSNYDTGRPGQEENYPGCDSSRWSAGQSCDPVSADVKSDTRRWVHNIHWAVWCATCKCVNITDHGGSKWQSRAETSLSVSGSVFSPERCNSKNSCSDAYLWCSYVVFPLNNPLCTGYIHQYAFIYTYHNQSVASILQHNSFSLLSQLLCFNFFSSVLSLSLYIHFCVLSSLCIFLFSPPPQKNSLPLTFSTI